MYHSNASQASADQLIQTPTDNDVLLGRGVSTNRHPGNVNFRNLVAEHVNTYVASTKKQKMMISRSIVDKVNTEWNPPGRFLEKQSSGLWSEVNIKKALEKTAQALRDGAYPLRKQLSEDFADPTFFAAVFDTTDGHAANGTSKPEHPLKSNSKKGHWRMASAPVVPMPLNNFDTHDPDPKRSKANEFSTPSTVEPELHRQSFTGINFPSLDLSEKDLEFHIGSHDADTKSKKHHRRNRTFGGYSCSNKTSPEFPVDDIFSIFSGSQQQQQQQQQQNYCNGSEGHSAGGTHMFQPNPVPLLADPPVNSTQQQYHSITEAQNTSMFLLHNNHQSPGGAPHAAASPTYPYEHNMFSQYHMSPTEVNHQQQIHYQSNGIHHVVNNGGLAQFPASHDASWAPPPPPPPPAPMPQSLSDVTFQGGYMMHNKAAEVSHQPFNPNQLHIYPNQNMTSNTSENNMTQSGSNAGNNTSGNKRHRRHNTIANGHCFAAHRPTNDTKTSGDLQSFDLDFLNNISIPEEPLLAEANNSPQKLDMQFDFSVPLDIPNSQVLEPKVPKAKGRHRRVNTTGNMSIGLPEDFNFSLDAPSFLNTIHEEIPNLSHECGSMMSSNAGTGGSSMNGSGSKPSHGTVPSASSMNSILDTVIHSDDQGHRRDISTRSSLSTEDFCWRMVAGEAGVEEGENDGLKIVNNA